MAAQAARQLALFGSAREAAFRAWLRDNPRIWELFVKFSFAVMQAGHRHYSADAICHRIRWHVQIDIKDASGFKINNDHVAFLARRFAEVYPEHAGFFRMRERGAG